MTRANYAEYKRRRVASANRSMQGVGPCQLTWWEFQDQADAQGGCWRPEINMRVGFRHLASLVERYGESDGARRYNGSGDAAEAYSRDMLAKARRWEAIIDGAAVPAARRALRRGDAGKGVERLTRRLSVVRSPATGRPYLDGVGRRLDGEVVRAVKAFQREHGLEPDGLVGPRTMHALRTRAENARRDPVAAGPPRRVPAATGGTAAGRPPRPDAAGGSGRRDPAAVGGRRRDPAAVGGKTGAPAGGGHATAEKPPRREDDRPERPARDRDRVEDDPRKRAVARVTAMADEVQRLEDETTRAWRALVVYGHRRRRRLLAERHALEEDRGGLSDEELGQLLAALARIEGKLGTLVEVTRHRPEVPSGEPAAPPAPAGVAGEMAPSAGPSAGLAGEMAPAPAAAAPRAVTVTQLAPVAPGAAAPGAAALAPERALSDYAVPELVRAVEAYEAKTRQMRDELIARYEKVDAELVRLLGPRARDTHPVSPARDGAGGGGPAVPHRAGLNGRSADPRHTPERPARPRPRPDGHRRGAADGASRSERDPLGGKVVNTTLGDRGLLVRRSKIALSRFLAKQGNPEHASLRRRLRREAATPRTGGAASPAWAKAVRAAQHVSGRPVTGELDGELIRLLLPYWPRDHAVKRIIRSTPGWRAIPGQLTPNFNVKELACKDAARTPYVQGLMREQGLSRKEALARAKGLAERLERVRKLGGDRPMVVTSAFRTKAYNASLSGSATNSAHTRGFAADTPPPRGISLEQHREHVMQAFECGVGYYPPGRGYFIHGDFDKTLGGRRTW